MPIDTSLYQILQPPRIQNPLEAVQQVLSGQKLASELRGLRQQEADDKAIRQALAETEGDVEKALPRLRQIAPKAALEFETEIGKARKEAALSWKAQTEAEIEQTKRTLQLFSGVNGPTYPAFLARVRKEDPAVGQLLPDDWDPVRFGEVHRIGLTTKDALEEQQRAFTLAAGNNPREALATYFKSVDNEQEWTEGLQKWQAAGTPRELLALVGPWDPQAPARVGSQLGITPMQQATLAGQEAARAQTAAHQGVLEAQGAARVAQGAQRVAIARQNAQTAAASGTLPPRVETTVRGLASAFRNEPSVKRTVTMGEAVSFVNGLDVNTKNPADDQALIYAFAKAMDPESVVREGEYATVQKYATSWLERFGFDAMRVLSSETPILTAQARSNLKNTITSRYQATRKQYDNLAKSYTNQINKATGGTDGSERLTDYAAVLPPSAETGGGTTGGGGGGSFGGSYQDYLRRQQGKK